MTMLRKLSLVAIGASLAMTAYAAGGAKHAEAPEEGWPFEGAFGEFDMDAMQRGYQVYREVCSSCHGMKLLAYRNLGEKGGPFYDPAYSANENPLVKEFAAQDEIYLGEDEIGEPIYGPATPADTFRSPYANENAARAANGGALPPDLSVITKARHGGASYVYSLLSGYPDFGEYTAEGNIEFPRAAVQKASDHGDGHDDEYHGTLVQPIGQYYNPYYSGDTVPQWQGDPRHAPPGGFLAMSPQLLDGRVEYMDGTEATIDQMASDVAQFLAWAAEPKQVNRKSAGLKVVLFLTVFAILLWFSYKQIWRDVKH